ncbi:MAG: DMT family transporter [Thermoplasmata archaeon]
MAERSSFATSGTARLLLLGLIWGATFPIARVGVEAGADPILLVALDLLLAAAVLAPTALLCARRRPPLVELARSAGLGALLIAGINLPLYWGLRFATGGTASILYATSPVVSVIAIAILGGAGGVHRRQLAALGVGLGGVVLLGVASPGGTPALPLVALAAFGIGAVCQGVGAVLVGRARPAGEGPWGLTFQFVGGAVASLILLPVLSPSLAMRLSAATIGSIAYVGIASMAVGYTLFFDLIHRSGAVRANQVTFLNPVVAVAVGLIAFAERVEPLEIAALGVILVALILLQPSHGDRWGSSAPRSRAGPAEPLPFPTHP